MDEKERSPDNQRTKYTRATARHLRRKKLREARKAEKQLLGSANDTQNTKYKTDDKIQDDKSALLILKTHDMLKSNIVIEENEINLNNTTTDNDTEVPKIKILPTITKLISKANTVNEEENIYVNNKEGKSISKETPIIENIHILGGSSASTEVKGIKIIHNSPSPETSDKMTDNNVKYTEKTREQVKAEREAKKAAKAAAKAKNKEEKEGQKENAPKITAAKTKGKEKKDDQKVIYPKTSGAKSKEGMESQMENTPKVASKVSSDVEKPISNEVHKLKEDNIVENLNESSTTEKVIANLKKDDLGNKNEGKSKSELRAERRAKQEAQRAAKQVVQKTKQELTVEKAKTKSKDINKTASLSVPSPCDSIKKVVKKPVVENNHEVSLFKHLYHERELALMTTPTVNSRIHPAIVQLGVQYANKIIVGSNARCVALLAAIKHLIQDFERPLHADFVRGLEAGLQDATEYLHHCRPLAVSMRNALRHLKWQMTKLPSSLSDRDAKNHLGDAIDTYIGEQIDLAGEAISATIQSKISNGNVILTYGYSSLIHKILLDAHKVGKQFRVVIVDARPWLEGKEQLRRLAKFGIDCSYILINALSFIMPEVSKVFLGAHAILANGAVMSRVGTAQVALMARAFNVPVLVACEKHKSSERVQTDSIVYNELGDADELTYNPCASKKSILTNWRTKKHLNLLNITYDVTPADLVTAVVTEIAILPCTSVPVILRIKPSEI